MTDTPPTRKARGSYAKSGATRAAILDAALQVFSESGYRAGSLREIANRVGMSEAGLLHHFRNKSSLLLAALDARDANSARIMKIEGAKGMDLLRGLVQVAVYNASEPGVVELFCTLSAEATSPDHPAHDYFVRRYEWTRGILAGAFEKVAAEGRLVSGMTPQRAAVATIALMDGLQVQWLLDRSVVDMPAALENFFRQLVSGYDMAALEQVLDLRVSLDGATPHLDGATPHDR